MSEQSTTHAQLCDEHRATGEKYAEARAVALSVFEDLLNVDDRARRVLEDVGLDTVEPRGDVAVDWYNDDSSYRDLRVSHARASRVWVGAGIAALVGAIGTQLGAWVVTGFGSVPEGALEWFGVGPIALGRIELALAPLLLSLIFLVIGVALFVVAYLLARRRARRAERDVQDANGTMSEAMERMEVNGARLQEMGKDARELVEELSRAIGALQGNRNEITVNGVYRAIEKVGGLYTRVQEPLPHARLYIGRPSPVNSLTSVETTMNAITIKWDDPDLGRSSIQGYRIMQGGGFLRGEKDLATVEETEFNHTGLQAGKSYAYRIIPMNRIGESRVSRKFGARTQVS